MKPAAIAVAVLSLVALGALTYQPSHKQEVLRDGMGDFNVPSAAKALKKNEGGAVLSVAGKPIETKFTVAGPPALSKTQEAIAVLKKAEAVFAEDKGGYASLIEKAREALRERDEVLSFQAQVYCGKTRQFTKKNEDGEGEEDCDFTTSGSVCFKGDIEQARDLITFATNEREYWYGGGENTFKSWIHDGQIHLSSRNTGTPMGHIIVVPCR